MISVILCQVTDYVPLIPQLGFGGLALWVVARGQERIEHVLRGLSIALWTDLAARPYADAFVKDQARKILTELELERKAR